MIADYRATCADRLHAQMGEIIVTNNSGAAVSVFVSNTSGGSDAWYSVPDNTSETWSRTSWEVVVFKNDDDTDRAGVYVRVDSTVVYKSLDDISVTTP